MMQIKTFRPLWCRRLVPVLLLGFLGGGVFADSPRNPSEILIERLLIRVVSDARLAYLIEAGKGRMNEDTREIELTGPKVQIFGEGEQVRQSVQSQSGRMWPVSLTVANEKGEEKVVSKYDWSLEGGVAFESVEGYRVRSEALNFSSADRNITSDRGVEYRMPTGRGTILSGKASQFEAKVDPDTGALMGWTLAGGVELSADPEKPPAEDSGQGESAPEQPERKKKKSVEQRIEDALEKQKDKLDARKKKD